MAILKNILYKILIPACVIFSAITLIISLTMLSLNFERPALLAEDLLIITLISIVFSCLNLIFRVKSLNFYVRLILHFIFSELALYLILLITTGNTQISNTLAGIRLFIVIIYAIAYVIVATIIVIRKLLKSSQTAESK